MENEFFENFNNDDIYERARERIRQDARLRRNCVLVGPTGPTGPAGSSGGATGPTGPTARFNKSSNKIIHNFKRIPF